MLVPPEERDLSEWARRDAAVAAASAVLRAKVAAAIPQVTAILAQTGVTEAILFGSMASGVQRPSSDVDIAVANCPPEQFYRLGAKLERALELPLDLVDIDTAPPEFVEQVRTHGLRIYPVIHASEDPDDQG